jgi:UDP-N-acetylmuramyl pentapeptide phosphotransferase/UDP-N-acetylglucosamine-1-phosphate transferase
VLFRSWIAGLLLASHSGKLDGQVAGLWSLCLAPVFFVGLLEDITKVVSPMQRLMVSFVTAALGVFLLGASLTRIDIPLIDNIFVALPTVAVLFTLFAVGGVAHAVNIVDGLNGLAAGVCFLAYAALGYVAFSVGDMELLALCTLGLGSLMGFYIWNYPSGQLFCGDGGAYFLGSYIALLSVLLVTRHPEVSAWFPLLLVLYPIWETLFSAYRRRFLRGEKSTVADKLHLHTLLYKRLHCGNQPHDRGPRRSRRNSDVSVHLIMLAGSTAIPAVLYWNCELCLLAAATIFILVYLSIYRVIVRFKLHRFVRRPAHACRLPDASQVAGPRLSESSLRPSDHI